MDNSLFITKKVSDKHNAFFGIVLLPRREQVYERVRWEAFSNYIHSLARNYLVSVVDMHGPLQQGFQINGKNLFIPWDGHNSQIASEIIAGVIISQMPALRKSKLIPNGKS